ncbi:hypothetical protein [Pararhizobium sp. DWP1-1-3]|uniref:hypothetical protein n=1 Tax=Pararhizobium sp. DWP1-1-3 TaxID=2804652 RepID=UPI003CECE150
MSNDCKEPCSADDFAEEGRENKSADRAQEGRFAREHQQSGFSRAGNDMAETAK